MSILQKGDSIRLVHDVGKLKAGAEGIFDDYIDSMTARVDLGGSKWTEVSVDDIEKVHHAVSVQRVD